MIIKNYAGFYYIQDEDKVIHACRVRGKLKARLLTGDRVIFTPLDGHTGILEDLLPRRNHLQRPRVANVTRVLIVMAYEQPKPDLMLLDRLLFLALYNGIVPCIIMNKCDLKADTVTSQILDYYPRICRIFTTSAQHQLGIEELSQAITGQIAVFAGPSGAGKSSLLQQLTGNSQVRTQPVSDRIGRGKHTTRHVELFPLPGGGWVADTPGFSVLDMPALRRERLRDYFPDFSFYEEQCQFGDCLHYRELQCGVKNALQEGMLLPSRYQNYVKMLEEIMEKERCY